MFDIIPIVLGILIIIFHQNLANFSRSVGKEERSPTYWKYAEEVIIIAGIILILKGLFSFLNK